MEHDPKCRRRLAGPRVRDDFAGIPKTEILGATQTGKAYVNHGKVPREKSVKPYRFYIEPTILMDLESTQRSDYIGNQQHSKRHSFKTSLRDVINCDLILGPLAPRTLMCYPKYKPDFPKSELPTETTQRKDYVNYAQECPAEVRCRPFKTLVRFAFPQRPPV